MSGEGGEGAENYRKYVIELAELIFLQIEFVELIFGKGRVGRADMLSEWF